MQLRSKERSWSLRLRLHSGLRQSGAHLSDGEAVAKVGHPGLWLGLAVGTCPMISFVFNSFAECISNKTRRLRQVDSM